ncbi:type I secretion system permease/ATPase [Sphingobium sp. EM0848]|uniref:type I secretion system permease/ATPase n=1 Tax=Sphingobium sp. EM0848 TaxID=2743473 RepID=UPI00159C284B|nr:ATP-binding cassette domain-containing protein [Sphingobium sp. EM0848]
MQDDTHHALRELTAGSRSTLAGLLFLTGVQALFPIILAIYCILVFDVAMVARSGESLLGIVLLMLVALAFTTGLALLRSRIMLQFANAVDIRLGAATAAMRGRLAFSDGSRAQDMQIGHAQDSVRAAISGPGALAALDLAAFPLFLIILFLFSGWLALALAIAGLIGGAFLLSGWRRARSLVSAMLPALTERHLLTENYRRHHGLVRALGMRPTMVMERRKAERRVAIPAWTLDRLATTQGVVSTMLINSLFAALIAIGAVLAVFDRASLGIVIAAALLGWKAMAPFASVANSLPGLALGWQSLRNLGQLLAAAPAQPDRLPLPAPTSSLRAEQIAVAAPGTRTVLLRDVSFTLTQGTVLGIIGMAGSGKSSLLKVLAGIWPTLAGTVRLDDAAIDQWQDDMLARHVGYMPQTIDLFDGTIADNIAHFTANAQPDDIIEAATAAGIHDMIVRMPEGYLTQVGEEGCRLSVAERQRIALARALYGKPFLLLLDEPATHLDGRGQQALSEAVTKARARGAICIIVGNASATVDAADYILVLRDGAVQDFGPKQDVRQRLLDARKPGRTEKTGTPTADGQEQ